MIRAQAHRHNLKEAEPSPPVVMLDADGDVMLDPMRLISTRGLVCANSGGGKSWLIRRIVEQTLTSIPTIILDREGEFATLRERFDVVLVGTGGEVPCAIATAGKLARRLIEHRVSAVVDLSDLAMADKRTWVRLFLEALIALPQSLWQPTLIVIDEAHQFAPEAEREATSLRAVVSLMDQGRKRGFGAILATQRLAKLHKDAAAEANNLFVGRFAQDVDLRRACDMLGFVGKDARGDLRSAPPGQFFALGPAIVADGVARFRCGPVLTTHPDPQHRHEVRAPQPSARIREIAHELADLQAEVEAEASELDQLRAKVREQAAALENAASMRAGPTDDEVQQMLADAKEHWYLQGRKVALERVLNAVSSLAGAIVLDHEVNVVVRGCDEPKATKAAKASAAPAPVKASGDRSRAIGRGVALAVMTALVQYNKPLSRAELGLLTLSVASAGSFGNVLSDLRGRGWIAGDRGSFVATAAGRKALGTYKPLPAGRALLEEWARRFGGGTAGLIFAALWRAGANGRTRAELGKEVGREHAAGSFGNCLTQLKGKGVMLKRDIGTRRGVFVLHPFLFEQLERRS